MRDITGLKFLGISKAGPPREAARPAQAAAANPLPTDRVANLPSGYRLTAGNYSFAIPSGRAVSVGRLEGSELFCRDDEQVSRQHAYLWVQDDRVYVRDRGSNNGTFVDGQRAKPDEWVQVKPGQMVVFGRTQLQLQAPTHPAPPVSSPAFATTPMARQSSASALRTAMAAVGGLSAPALSTMVDFRELVADRAKQLKKFGQLIPDQPNAYWQNNAQARLAFQNYLAKGDFYSVEGFKSMLQNTHALAVEGLDGNHRYYEGSGGVLGPNKLPAGQFHSGVTGGVRPEMSAQVAALAEKYGDPYRDIAGKDGPAVYLPGIHPDGLPQNRATSEGQRHSYPKPRFFGQYFQQMQLRLQRLEKPGASREEVLSNIAEFYQYGANSRPFRHVNNSLFMNFTNDLLRRHGFTPVFHGILDHAAHRLQPAAFNRYFKDWAQGEGKIDFVPTPFSLRHFSLRGLLGRA